MDRPDGRLNAWILAWDAHALLHAPGAAVPGARSSIPLPDALAFSENLLLPARRSPRRRPLLGRAGARVQLRAAAEPRRLRPRRAAARRGASSGDRLARLRGRRVLRGRRAPLDPPGAPARAGHALPPARAARARPLLAAPHAGGAALLVGPAARAAGAVARSTWARSRRSPSRSRSPLALLGGLRGREAAAARGRAALARALLVAPVARPYLRMRAFQGVEWTLDDVATLRDDARVVRRVRDAPLRPPDPAPSGPRARAGHAVPGLVPLVLGLAGLAARAAPLSGGGARRPRPRPSSSRWVRRRPLYRFLHEHVVLVRGVRALSRFSLVPVLALSRPEPGSRWPAAAAWRCWRSCWSCWSPANAPIGYAPRAPGRPTAARWLAGRAGAVAHLPLGERRHARRCSTASPTSGRS